MRRLRNQPKREMVGAYPLRARIDYHRMLLEIDFQAPQVHALEEALSARIDAPVQRLTLSELHWIIAQLLVRDGASRIQLAEKCSQCASILELELDIGHAVEAAEPALRRGSGDARLRLPTTTDLECANRAEELVARCSLEPIELAEADRILQDADPLGLIELRALCCICGGTVEGSVDLAAKWLTLERQSALDLLEEIHTLARNYHWSEREILELSDISRRRYIEMCRAEDFSRELEQNV